jgi:phosphatidylglycerophosphatase A
VTTPALIVATLGGLGTVRHAPGTWGSLLVLPVVLLGPTWCLGLGLLLGLLGWWAVRVLARTGADRDPPWVVVDEGAGQLLALAGLPDDPTAAGLVLAFGLFRALDILKPWPVGWLDRRKGPAWVMLDDMCAGAIAAAGMLAFGHLYPGVLG